MASRKRDVRDTVWKFQHLIKRNYRRKAQRCWWRGNYQNCDIKKNFQNRGAEVYVESGTHRVPCDEFLEESHIVM